MLADLHRLWLNVLIKEKFIKKICKRLQTMMCFWKFFETFMEKKKYFHSLTLKKNKLNDI